MPGLLTDLEEAARGSGLIVRPLPGWATNYSAGAFGPGVTDGVLVHHTGSYDDVGDTSSDEAYALWLAFTGRDDLNPPLCNLALTAEGVVYVCAAGNANHAGEARPSGPMPAAADGSALYAGIEAYNSGSQGWGTVGVDAAGRPVTQYDAYVRLCAALCRHYGWPASHVRAHKETSVTGKWDPGLLDMDAFRADVARLIEHPEDDMPLSPDDLAKIGDLIDDRLAKALTADTIGGDKLPDPNGAKRPWSVATMLWTLNNKASQILTRLTALEQERRP